MSASNLALFLLPDTFAVCRLEPDAEVPPAPTDGGLYSLTRTGDELSLVCAERHIPEGARAESGWRVLVVAGPLAFEEVGILAELAGALADAGISLFALSTFDTDYLLVKQDSLDAALEALRRRGHTVHLQT